MRKKAKERIARIGRAAVAAVTASVLMLPSTALAAAPSVGSDGETDDSGLAATKVYMTADNNKLLVTVPTKIGVAVSGDGTFVTPSPSAAKITNKSSFKVHLEEFQAVAENGFHFDSGSDLVAYTVTPNADSAGTVAAGSYAEAAQPAGVGDAKWDMAAATYGGDAIELTTAGAISAVTKDLTSEQQFATLNWTFGAGAGVEQASYKVTITGDPDDGATLTASVSNADGKTVAYQWKRDGADIEGATSSTYTYDADKDDGHSITCEATVDGESATGTYSVYTAMSVSVSGTPEVGQTLTANVSSAPEGAAVSYQWYRSNSLTGQSLAQQALLSAQSIAVPSGYTAIDGATSQTYTLTDEDAGRTVGVAAAANGATGYSAVKGANATVDVDAGETVYSALKVAIEGTFEDGADLTAAVTGEPAGAVLSYSWKRAGTAIAGETESTYTYDAETDDNNEISVTVSATAAGYDRVLPASAAAIVYNGMSAMVSGTPSAGSELSVVVTGAPADAELSYQWYRNSAAIDGETGQTYTYLATDDGESLTALVTATSATYTYVRPAMATLSAYAGMTASISGDVSAGDGTLTATPSNHPPAAALSYQWRRDGADIDGATGSTYTYRAATDDDHTISVEIAGTGGGYTHILPATATYKVHAGMTASISGAPSEGGTLTASAEGAAAGAALSYQWTKGGSDIAGATGSTLAYDADYDDEDITVTVAATATGYDYVRPATSSPVKSCNSAAVSITGTPVAGQTLTASASGVPADATVSYQWRLDGAEIAGATTESLSYTSDYDDHAVTVTATAAASGYTYINPMASEAVRAHTGVTVSVTGTPKTGSALTAEPAGAPEGATCSYQWYSDGNAISGATNSTLTYATTYDDKPLTVKVTPEADGYTYINEAESTALKANNSMAATISGDGEVGTELTAAVSGRPEGVTLGYQWYLDGEPIEGATDLSITVLEGHKDRTLKFVVSAAELGGYSYVAEASKGMIAGLSSKGSAYAVLDSEGTLTLFRSGETYTAGADQTVTDIAGNEYTGQVYTGYEESTATNSSNKKWSGQEASIKAVTVASSQKIHPKSCVYWFSGCTALESVNLTGLDTSSVTNMSGMFNNCTSLTSLDVSGFDTSSVTDMQSMFYYCSALTSLDVNGFDTSSVTDAHHMFFGCSALTTLDVSGFDTSSVTSVGNMFSYCSSLTTITGFNTWDTSSITNMSGLFFYCTALTTIQSLNTWDTSSVTNMSGMFSNCTSLTSLDVSGFDTSSVTDMMTMFRDCSSLTSIDVSGFDTSSVTDMSCMFWGCKVLTSLDTSNFKTSSVTKMGYMFADCSKLTILDLSSFDTSSVTGMNGMFKGCSSLTTIYTADDANWSKVAESSNMFTDCYKLKGGNGTSYMGSYQNAALAKVDGLNGVNGTKGYFTAKA